MPSTPRRAPRVASAWLLVAAACAGEPGTSPPRASGRRLGTPLGVEAALASRVNAERAAERVRALCALGPRMGGTRSGERAAALLLETFESMGLEARVVEDPPTRSHEESAWRVVVLPEGGEAFELESAWPYGFSPTTRGTARLELEPAVGGVLLAERPLRGREGPRPALVLVDGVTTADGSYPVVLHLRSRSGEPIPHFGLARADGERLRALLAEGVAVEVEFELETEIREASPLTVVARLPAREPRGAPWTADHLLVCAHGDSDAGGPGADDNASGVAAVLEVAQAWSEAIASGLVAAPEHEVRFAVWGSEIHSSRAYLERRGPQDGELLGVLNFDQAGFGSGADRVHVEPDDLPANRRLARTLLAVLRDHAPGTESHPLRRAPLQGSGERSGAAVAPAEAGATPYREAFPREWASVRSLGGTDSYVFSASSAFREGALPSMTVYTSAWGRPAEHARTEGMPGESWSDRDVVAVDHDVYYHSAGDIPENTTDREPWNSAWCARVALLGARRFLAGTEQAP